MSQKGLRNESSQDRYRRFILLLFFLSGASALIYQIVWIRMLGLIFGVTIFAVSAVLTSYMFGLAFGSLIFGKIADRHSDPLRLFMYLEAGIGVFALLFPFLYDGLSLFYVFIHQTFHTGFYANSIIRFILSFLLLIIPTTLMGGTLPVLSKLFIRRLRELGWDVGMLYSFNNLGATLGCLAAGFYLINAFGNTASILFGAFINILIAAAAFLLRNKFSIPHSPFPAHTAAPAEKPGKREIKNAGYEANQYPPQTVKLVLWVFAIEGFSALAYEVIWTRILSVFIDSTVYFYTTIVISFIFGLSLGSILIAKAIDRKLNLLALLGYIEIIIGGSAVALLPFFSRLPHYFGSMDPNTSSWWSHSGVQYGTYFLLLLVPTTLMGTTFPIVTRIYTTNLKQLGSRLGNIGFLDTVGSILGSFAAGFIMIPFLGVIKAVIVTALINLIVGSLLIIRHPFLKSFYKITALALCLAILIPAYIVDREYDYFRHWEAQEPGDILRYYKEGASATVAVPEHPDGVKMLAINGSVTLFAEYGDLRVNKMLGYLPLLMHDSPENGLVVGLGMGVSFQALVQPYMKYVDCAEISPEVLEACRVFHVENKNVLDNPKINVIIEDGRSHLLITEKHYDIITSNAVHAKLSNSLYTADFYEICKRKLTSDGIMCQWLPTNWLSVEEYKQLIHSFMHVFPYTSLWIVDTGHTILIGSPQPVKVNFERLKERIAEPKTHEELALVGLDNVYEMLTQFIADESTLDEYVKNSRLNTDDKPHVEFSKTVNKKTDLALIQDFINLRTDALPPFVDTGNSGETREKRARTMQTHARSFGHYLRARLAGFQGRGFDSIKELLTAREINPGNGLVNYMYGVVSNGFQEYVQQLKNQNNYDGAISFCNQALEIIQDWPLALAELGVIYNDLGRYNDALNSLNRSLEKEPSLERGLVGLGVTYLNLQNIDESFSALEKARAINPDNLITNFHLGIIYSLKNEPDSAVTFFTAAIEINPQFYPPYEELGKLYKRQGKYIESIRVLEKAVRNIPGSIRALYELADAYRLEGRKNEAAAVLSEILRLDSNQIKAREMLQHLDQ